MLFGLPQKKAAHQAQGQPSTSAPVLYPDPPSQPMFGMHVPQDGSNSVSGVSAITLLPLTQLPASVAAL